MNTLLNNVMNKDRLCYIEGCNNVAIDSHILQRKVILETIAENNYVMRWVQSFFNPLNSKFKKEPVRSAFTFKLFCPKHDHKLFKSLESQDEINFNDYLTRLLLSYRSLYAAKRMKECNVEWCQAIVNAPSLKGLVDKNFGYKMIEEGNLLDIDFKYYKEAFQMDFENLSTPNFIFHHKQIPRIPICCNSTFTYETNEDINLHNLTKIDIPLTSVFINIIPNQTTTNVIIGYHKDKQLVCGLFFEKMFQLNIVEFLKELSDLILTNSNYWACSQSFYFKYLRNLERDISKVISENFTSSNRRRLRFGLFDKINLKVF